MITATQVIIHSFCLYCPFLFAVSVLSEEFAVALHEVRIKAFPWFSEDTCQQSGSASRRSAFDAPRP